jgi:FAD binding domain
MDVAKTILFARRSGLPVAARSGGHCFAGRSSTQGIVIDVTPMRSVSVSDGRATVGAGDPGEPPTVKLLGAMTGTEADTARLLEELVARVDADPASAVRKHLSYREAKRHLAELGAEDQLEASPPGGLAQPGHSFSQSLPSQGPARGTPA